MVTARATRFSGAERSYLPPRSPARRLRWTDWTTSIESRYGRRDAPSRTRATIRTFGSYCSASRASASPSPARAFSINSANSAVGSAMAARPGEGGRTPSLPRRLFTGQVFGRATACFGRTGRARLGARGRPVFRGTVMSDPLRNDRAVGQRLREACRPWSGGCAPGRRRRGRRAPRVPRRGGRDGRRPGADLHRVRRPRGTRRAPVAGRLVRPVPPVGERPPRTVPRPRAPVGPGRGPGADPGRGRCQSADRR